MALSTAQVLDHHLKAFGVSDLAGLLEDYSEDSFILAPDGTALRGLAGIRPLFEAFIAEFSLAGASFSMGLNVVEDNIAFITWSADTPSNRYEFGADTFVIRNGKIVAQTVAAKVTPKR